MVIRPVCQSLVLTILAAPILTSCGAPEEQTRLSESEGALTCADPNPPEYLFDATGELMASASASDGSSQQRSWPWPFQLRSLAQTNANLQQFSGEPYFHHGLDIRGDAGQEVRMPFDGTGLEVVNYRPGQPLYWRVAVTDPDGFIWQFHHIEQSSIPKEVRIAAQNKAPIRKGTLLGRIASWPNAWFGETYHHVHLNVIASGGRYVSPLMFLERLEDTTKPVITGVGLLQNGRPVQGTTATGDFSIMADISDLTMHEKFINPPHDLKIRLNDGAPTTVWNFATIPGGSDINAKLWDLYVQGSACGDYTCRRHTMNLGFSQNGISPFAALGDGQHKIEIIASDYNGNSSSASWSFTVSGRGNVQTPAPAVQISLDQTNTSSDAMSVYASAFDTVSSVAVCTKARSACRSAADASLTFQAIYQSGGRTWFKSTAPLTLDPGQNLTVMAFARDGSMHAIKTVGLRRK